MREINKNQVEQNATNQINVTSTTWTQWGKAALAFTVATGAYALTKAAGLLGGSTIQAQVQPPLNQQTSIITSPVAAPTMQYPSLAPETIQPLSPHSNTNTYIPSFITLSTMSLTAPRYPLITLSTLGISLFQSLPGAQAVFPATLDLASLTASQGFTLLGAAADDLTGYSVSTAGDVNGDGLTDMLVGANSADPLSRNLAGVAYLLFGRNSSWPAAIDLASLNASLGVVLQGAAAGDQTGISVSAAGDVNGDGLSDMLVGAYLANPLSRSSAGVAYLLFGCNDSWPAMLDLGNLTSSQGVVLQGAVDYDRAGNTVSAVGDINGDGLADVLVGAYGASPLSRNLAGAGYLLFGRNDSWPAMVDLGNLTSSQGVVLQGAAADDSTGNEVSAVGDINGDGLTDMLVGADSADPLSRNLAGVAYLLFGRTGSWPAVMDLASLSGGEGVVLQGAVSGDRTGSSVSAAGDINGDGIADVLVGAFKAAPLNRSEAGVAYLLFGRNGSWPAVLDLGNLTNSQGVVLQGAAVFDQTGISVSSAGDVNGDGLADVLVGANLANPLSRSDAGVAYLLFGHNGSWPAAVDLGNLTSNQGVILQGGTISDSTGISVSAAGDINGDSLADVLVGAYQSGGPLGGNRAGLAYVIIGQGNELSNLTLTIRTDTTSKSSSVLIQTPSPSTTLVASTAPSAQQTNLSLASDTNALTPSRSASDTTVLSSQSTLTTARSSLSTTGGMTLNAPGFTIVFQTVLYLEVGIDVTLTTEHLSVEGFTGPSSQLAYTISDNQAYMITVNGIAQNTFTQDDIAQGWVVIRVEDSACLDFDVATEIPMQASDGTSTADFNLLFRLDTNSCSNNDASTLNAKSLLQGVGLLLVGSGLGLLTSNRRERTKANRSDVEQSRNRNDNHDEMKLSK